MNSFRPIYDEKLEATKLLENLISERFEYGYYNRSRHILSFRSDLPTDKLQDIANQLHSLGLNIKALAGVPGLFSSYNFPARIEINNSYEDIIKFLQEPTQRLDNNNSLVDTSHSDAINNIREKIAAVLKLKK